jgi:hypothetical protein
MAIFNSFLYVYQRVAIEYDGLMGEYGRIIGNMFYQSG